MTVRSFTDDQAAVLLREYESGKNCRQIVEQYGSNETTVRKTILRAGGKMRSQTREARPDLIAPRKFPTVEDCLPLREEYEAGRTMAELAKKYSCNARTVSTAIKRAGGTLRPLGRPSLWDEHSTAQVIVEYRAGRDVREIAADLGVDYQAVRAKLKRERVMPISPRLKRASHGSWRGGRITTEGYVYIKPADEDLTYCRPNSNGYVAEHRLVVAKALGRKLLPTETVHHKNGVRGDNRLENLQLRQGNHGKGSSWACADCGSHNLTPVEI